MSNDTTDKRVIDQGDRVPEGVKRGTSETRILSAVNRAARNHFHDDRNHLSPFTHTHTT